MPDEEQAVSSTVAPGTLTALLREVARSPAADEKGRIPILRPGQIIGRFELVREIGRGGFGVVYEARDRELGRAVALKAVRMGGNVELKQERLLREAEAAAQLSHPNIVTLHDMGRFDHGPYLVMELLRGCSLAERLRAGALSVPEALRIAVEVAKALAHAHAHGVVHRDLTPGNVFLCDDGHAKVLDFGMAQAFGRPKLDGGTQAYMAPEQCRGAPEDARTDVFALGVMLHHMISGKVPFADVHALESAAGPPELRLRDGGPLAELVSRMLARDAAERPRDGAAILTELSAAQASLERTREAGASVGAERGSRARVLRRLVLLVAAGVGVSAATVAVTQRRPRAAAASGATEHPPEAVRAAAPDARDVADLPAGAVPPRSPRLRPCSARRGPVAAPPWPVGSRNAATASTRSPRHPRPAARASSRSPRTRSPRCS